MTRIIFIILLLSFNLNAQDSLLLTEMIIFDQDSNITRRWSGKYNKFGLIIYSESVNYQRKDTSRSRTYYDRQKRISKYIQNGPYYPDKYDTTYYTYSGDTTIIIQGDKHQKRITKKDKLDRQFYFSAKTYNENGTLILHELDSIIYDDFANSRVTRAYRMENYLYPPNPKVIQEMYIDGEWQSVEAEIPELIKSEEKKKKPELELMGTGFAQYNSFDKVTHMITSFPGNETEVFVEYDSLGRHTRHEIFKKIEDYHKITTYEYELKGDTLIKYQRNSEKPNDLYINKESRKKRDGQPLWSIGSFNGKPSGSYYRIYDDNGYLVETSHWRPKKDSDELLWNIERTVYKYELLPISE